MRSIAVLCLAIACGGKATNAAGAAEPPAVSPDETPSADAGGVGLSVAGAPGAPNPVTCLEPAPACRLEDTFVEIDDGVPVRLSVPLDAGCASCWVPCEDCGSTCEVSAAGVSSCGTVTLKVGVCSGDDHVPPCLSTVADDPYYLDAAGKTWSVLALSGVVEAQLNADLLEADLSLVVGDGVTTRELSTHVRVCADLAATLRPCK